MKNVKIILYVFIALLFCGALVHDSNIINDGIEIENGVFYKNYEINEMYVHGNTVYYDIGINKKPIMLN